MAKQKSPKNASKPIGKVGDDPIALEAVGGKGDFGIPARDPVARAHDGEIEGRPAGSAPGYTGDMGVRTTGVGSMGGPPGMDSGGDLDPDFIGFDGKGGLAAKPPRGDMGGADSTDGSSDAFASGRHAPGRNAIKKGSHGASPQFEGNAIDHSGEDASTNGPTTAGAVKSLRGEDPGAEGEVTMDEATGDIDQGAEQ